MTKLPGFSMASHASRTYSEAKDLQSMLDLLVAVRPADRITEYPGPVDLREILALRTVQENTRLWFGAEGQMTGFAFVDQYNNLWFEADPKAASPDLESEMIAWGVEVIRRTVPENGKSWTLDASCRDDNRERIALLERHGFVRQAICSLHMVRRLDEPIPTPQAPAGFRTRHVEGEQEASALVSLHRAAFGSENMTVEERLAMMRLPDYDPELDLVAVAPDGGLAAYCMCSIHQEENRRSGRNEGYTDPVATHPEFQRLGLATVLLLTGLRELKQRGMDRALLGTSCANVAMQRTAQAVGFRCESTTLWFARQVSQNCM